VILYYFFKEELRMIHISKSYQKYKTFIDFLLLHLNIRKICAQFLFLIELKVTYYFILDSYVKNFYT